MRSRSVGLFVTAMLLLTGALAPRPAAAAGLADLGPLPATYSGVLPCADCPGIEHQLNLLPGGAYMLAMTYLRSGADNRTFHVLGTWSLSADSTVLVCSAFSPKAMQLAVAGRGKLRMLDLEGHEISPDPAYELTRKPEFAPLEMRVPLRATYSSAGGVGSIADCATGLRWPVAPGEAAGELERALQAERDAAGAEKVDGLVVSIECRIAPTPPAGVAGEGPTLVVERVLDTFPGEVCGERWAVPLGGTRWVPTRIGRAVVRPPAGEGEAYMVIDEKAGRVAGFGGCTRFATACHPGKPGFATLTFDSVSTTPKPCPSADTIEKPLLDALGKVVRYQLAGSHLELYSGKDEMLVRFEARGSRK